MDRERNGGECASDGKRVLSGLGKETEEFWARERHGGGGQVVSGVGMCKELSRLSVEICGVDRGPKGCGCEEGCDEFCLNLHDKKAVELVVAPRFGVVGGVRGE